MKFYNVVKLHIGILQDIIAFDRQVRQELS